MIELRRGRSIQGLIVESTDPGPDTGESTDAPADDEPVADTVEDALTTTEAADDDDVDAAAASEIVDEEPSSADADETDSP